METKESSAKTEKTLLEAIERIVELSRDSKLSSEFMESAKAEIKLLAGKYGITERQAILFSVCMEVGPNHIDYYHLGDYLGLGKISVFKYASDIDALVHHRLLRCKDADNEDEYKIPSEVLRCLKHNEVFKMPKRTELDCPELFGVLNQLFTDFDEHCISLRDLKEETDILFKENQQVGFVKAVQRYNLFESDLILLLFFCHKYVNDDEYCIGYWDLKDLFANSSDYCIVKRELMAGESNLQEKKLVEICCDDGIADVERYRLTDKAKGLLAELGLSNANKRVADVLDSSKLPYKKLFFASTTQRQFDELSHLLNEDNFKQIQERMKAKGFRNGFACLFYGGPGTGKTESVYQLARQTGRNIMIVDIPGLRDKFVGETEKNMKAVFERYRDCVKNGGLYPILLFNEADAIIGKRKSGADGAVDKMENSLLNIVLQEMEQLDGIMIATTNLEENMDKAFERRFLYKIKFEKPSLEARTHIWHSMIPELKESDVRTLASKYDFSGGQIENIARHYAIDSILHDQNDDVLVTLISHCDSERLESKNSGRIGF